MIKPTYSAFFLVVGLCMSSFTHAEGEVQKQINSLGIVSGRVENHQLKLKETLGNPIVFSVEQNQLSVPLSQLLVERAVSIGGQSGEINVRIASSLGGKGTTYSQYTLELWLDGKKENIQARAVRRGVLIKIPKESNLVEVRVTKPINITLPQHHRGRFTSSIEITAL